MIAWEDIVAGVGVFLILLAFFLQTFHFIKANSRLSFGMNAVGSALAAYGSYLIGSVPFLVLECTWCIVSLIGFFRKTTK